MKRQIISGIFYGLSIALGFAQAPTEKVSLRILATGQPPTTEIEIRGDEGSVEKEVDPDLLPPSTLHVSLGKKAYDSARVSLGVYGMPVEAQRAANKVVRYQKSGSGEEATYRSWAQLNVPLTSEAGTILMYKDPKRKDWKQPILKYLPDDQTAFPKGTFRIINTSTLTLKVVVGEESLTASPGKVILTKAHSGDDPVRYSVTTKLKGKTVKLANSAAPMEAGTRTNLVIAPQAKSNSRRPARVSLFRDETS